MVGTTGPSPNKSASGRLSTIPEKVDALEDAVLGVTEGILEKFLPAPNRETVINDLLIGLQRFRNTVRWKSFFLAEKEESSTPQSGNEKSGLGTGVRTSYQKKRHPQLPLKLRPF